MKSLFITLAALGHIAAALAYPGPATGNLVVASHSPPKRSAVAQKPALPAAALRMAAPVVTAPGTAQGQAGYIHYFVITGPDGEPETQVGIELPGDRIAWSFPEMGVGISPFVASGQVIANGKPYDVAHLYGVRPFPDEDSMAALRRDLDTRVSWWLEQKTPYCDEERPSNRLCLSCLGFVVRVLFPGASPALPAMPADFRSARKNMYTTEDLLLYLAGVRLDLARPARLQRIDSINVPQKMREELVRIVTDVSPQVVEADVPRPAVAKPRSTGRSMVQSPKRAPRRGS